MSKTIFHVLLIASFAMWFGGFGFYVSFVVPTGNEVLGSSFEQGLITRRVTTPLNWLGLLASVLMILNSALIWNRKPSRARRVAVGCAVLMLAMQIALFWLHPQIDLFVDLESHEIVGDYDQFYFLHRLYLWASTIQWAAAWIWLFAYVMTNAMSPAPSADA